MNKINWNMLWTDFNEWFQTECRNAPRCIKCHHREYSDPEWDAQERKIKELVEDQLNS